MKLKNFLRKKPSEEAQIEREIIEEAKIRGREAAKTDKLKQKIKRAEDKAYEKEMKGKFGGTRGTLKTVFDSAMQVSQICADVAGGFYGDSKPKKKQQKKKRRKKKDESYLFDL